MLQQADYSIHDQYACLLFFRTVIIPALGEQPDVSGRPSQWESYTTDDFSPIEYSWNWDGAGDKPKIRFSIEAIGLGGDRVGVKAYFMPMLRSLETNQSRVQVVARAFNTLSQLRGGAEYPALEKLISFMRTDFLGCQTEVEMLSVDCLDPKDARIKIYIRHPQTSWKSVRAMMTMNGQIKVSEDDQEELWRFWRAVLSLDEDYSKSAELPKCDHSTAGMFYCFYAREGDKFPTPKLYVPAKHYGRNDRAIADGLAQYFGDRGKDSHIDNYKKVVEQLSNHRPLESQCGIHTYISCRFTDHGLSVTSYLSPEIYHPARWTSGSSPRMDAEYVFGRDYSASAR